MTTGNWRDASKAFFDHRAAQIAEVNLRTLCYVSGREPRLWSDERLYSDMLNSIIAQVGATRNSSLLEVGCASGFLAWGLAPRVGTYLGLDVAPRAVRVARKLSLANARFRVADGANLSLPDDTFDTAICYDVFTNFPNFDLGAKIIREMVRVVKPGGRVLIGSVPDEDRREDFVKHVAAVMRDLDERYGPPPRTPDDSALSLLDRLRARFRRVEPGILCYYFKREDFVELGQELGAKVEIADIHSMNPYAGFRFNAIYTKTQDENPLVRSR